LVTVSYHLGIFLGFQIGVNMETKNEIDLANSMGLKTSIDGILLQNQCLLMDANIWQKWQGHIGYLMPLILIFKRKH
jgi:hypothetical protein